MVSPLQAAFARTFGEFDTNLGRVKIDGVTELVTEIIHQINRIHQGLQPEPVTDVRDLNKAQQNMIDHYDSLNQVIRIGNVDL